MKYKDRSRKKKCVHDNGRVIPYMYMYLEISGGCSLLNSSTLSLYKQLLIPQTQNPLKNKKRTLLYLSVMQTLLNQWLCSSFLPFIVDDHSGTEGHFNRFTQAHFFGLGLAD